MTYTLHASVFQLWNRMTVTDLTLPVVVWLNELIRGECLKQYLAHSQNSTQVRHCFYFSELLPASLKSSIAYSGSSQKTLPPVYLPGVLVVR